MKDEALISTTFSHVNSTLQGVNDETLISTILSSVKLGELSMEEMCNEFEKYVCGLVYVLNFIF